MMELGDEGNFVRFTGQRYSFTSLWVFPTDRVTAGFRTTEKLPGKTFTGPLRRKKKHNFGVSEEGISVSQL